MPNLKEMPTYTATAMSESHPQDESTSADIDTLSSSLANSLKVDAPMVQRFATHRDRVELVIKELENERYDLQSKLDEARRQFEALETGIKMHLSDIEQAISLYEAGLHSLGAQE